MSRYNGKPFLRFLDCYVLRAIGELDPQQESALRSMEPKLTQVYGQAGSWFEIVALQMEFPPGLPEKIREVWEAGKARMAQQGMMADPGEFTRQFVDANFPT